MPLVQDGEVIVPSVFFSVRDQGVPELAIDLYRTGRSADSTIDCLVNCSE